MAESLTVRLGEREYPILIDRETSASLESRLAEAKSRGRKIVILTDRNVAQHASIALKKALGDFPQCVVEPGETAKSLNEYGRVLDILAQHAVDRTGVLVAIGGGVIGDLGGFVAASYLRGIDFLQVPTTLLAMVDSSVGGKTGINLSAGKNLVGAFHQPRAVFISTDSLLTLPSREFAAGAAEVIKYGLLGDAELFARLEREPLTPRGAALAETIKRCCAIKAKIVEADERETAKEGGRALLNLGHTFAHAIEQVAGYGTYLHGEAVAIGLCAAARLSEKLGLIAANDVRRLASVVAAHRLPTKLNSPLPLSALMAAMSRDKKVRNGVLRFVVLNALGTAATRDDIDPGLAEGCFREVGAD